MNAVQFERVPAIAMKKETREGTVSVCTNALVCARPQKVFCTCSSLVSFHSPWRAKYKSEIPG